MLKEKDKIIYAVSLVSQLGFYIAVPFLIAILGGSYLDKILLDKYLLPGQHVIHHGLVLLLTFLTGIYSVWQIRILILPLLEEDDERGEYKMRNRMSQILIKK